MQETKKRQPRQERTKVGNAKDPEKFADFGKQENVGAYDANTKRLLKRRSIDTAKGEKAKSRSNALVGRSNRKSGSAVTARSLPQRQLDIINWKVIWKLLERAVFQLVLSVLLLLLAIVGGV